jgi:hypothetical protein
MFGNSLKFPTKSRADREVEAALDSLNSQQTEQIDPIDNRAAMALMWSIREQAWYVVKVLVDAISEGKLDELTPSEFLDSALLYAMGVDTEEGEQADSVLNALFSAHIADAFSSLGVADDMVADILGDDVTLADTTLESAVDIVVENMPSEGEPMDRFVNDFVYGNHDENGDDDLDSELDALTGKSKKPVSAGQKTTKKVNGKTLVYKATKAIRNGHQVVVNKRISGTVKLSAKQRNALHKAQMKAHTGTAIKRQMRSLGKGIAKGLYKAHGLMKASTQRYRNNAHT